jgi:hypothetical protein
MPTPFAARSFSSGPSPSNNKPAQPSVSTKHSTKPSSVSTTTIGIHCTRDGRKFISQSNMISSACRPTCLLCYNKHVNPWHPTEHCPYKHPTHILPKDVRERVMQHNALHGSEKQDYNKEQDLPQTKSTPPQAASAILCPEATVNS